MMARSDIGHSRTSRCSRIADVDRVQAARIFTLSKRQDGGFAVETLCLLALDAMQKSRIESEQRNMLIGFNNFPPRVLNKLVVPAHPFHKQLNLLKNQRCSENAGRFVFTFSDLYFKLSVKR